MACNKNQHYVPKVYLKPFTLDRAGLAINLLNLDRMRPIRNARVRNQSSGDYFYGQDEKLERAIHFVEDAYGPVVTHLEEEGAVDARVDIVLRRFICLQYLRTEAASHAAAEMALALTDVPGSDVPVPSFPDAAKAAVQQAMLQYTSTMRIVDDLKLTILRNRTELPFVTSDNPAILTNRLHIQRPALAARSFGAGSAGALFLLPLTPALFAVLHDADTYSLNHVARSFDVAEISDVTALNEHQYLHCMANIYFGAWEGRDEVLHDAATARPRRPVERLTVVHAVLDKTSDWGERFVVEPIADIRDGRKWLVHVKTNQPVPSAWPSFLPFRPGATAWSNDTGAGLTRRGTLDRGFATGANYRKVRV